MKRFTEEIDEGWGQFFDIEREVLRERSAFQNIRIFDNPLFGRVLVLDGAVQTTMLDEHIYHEMLVHVPLMTHGSATEVLIVGGGDGGALREVLRHPVTGVTLVEIDGAVIDACRMFMPALSAGAFDDARAEVVIADAAAFVQATERRFDIVLIDSTDPGGPADSVFSTQFYSDCSGLLRPGGLLAAQHGVAFLSPEPFRAAHRRLAKVFGKARAYQAPVPSYSGGPMTFSLAGSNIRPSDAMSLQTRWQKLDISTRHYSPAVHAASFALSPEIIRLTKPE